MKLTKQEKSERNRLVWALAMALHRAMGEEARRASQQNAFADQTWRPAWWGATGIEDVEMSDQAARTASAIPAAAASSAADACTEDLAGMAP